ncbi:MAG: hypothetical protein WA051_00040 [Minisyncoccia bacterium]
MTGNPNSAVETARSLRKRNDARIFSIEIHKIEPETQYTPNEFAGLCVYTCYFSPADPFARAYWQETVSGDGELEKTVQEIPDTD